MSRQDETRQAKIEKREKLETEGVLVHPYNFAKTHTVSTCRDSLGETVTTAGRIMSLRTHGKVSFLDLQDHTGKIQVMIKEETVGKIWHDRISLIDPSDHLGVTGTIIQTKTGEITIEVSELTVLSKALRVIPATFQGIEDKEVRFRKRYIDMLIDPEVKRVLDARWLIEKEIRRYLQDIYQFVEVETPVLQPLYGGTNAKPFTTYMNALDSNYYLRIAPELYLKRLIVGGYDRVFEIARNFRNEGIDQTHQPEFTMMEWYEAYADYHRMMDVAEGLYKHLAEKVNGNLELTVGEVDINLSGDWPRITMEEALSIHNKMDVVSASDDELKSLLSENNLEITGTFSRGKAIFSLFDHLTTPFLINPTWIIDYPKEVSPLAKAHRSKEGFVERFELYVGTKEMADGWSEITDALEQRRRFENEQKNMREGDAEAQPLDEDFLEAMEYGMPPLGGIGMGIDRMVMFLTNTWSIKEVIAFPTLRPTPEQLKASQMMESHNKKPTVASKDAVVSPKNTSTIVVSHEPLTHETAMVLLESMVENPGLRGHMKAMELQMRGLWEYFSKEYASDVQESQDTWGILGLLHDADWERTESVPDQHTLVTTERLQELGVSDAFCDSIRSHNFRGVVGQREPQTLMEWSLSTSDHLSGIIIACALVMPEKKLANVTVERVLKKFKEKSFAKGATREEILEGLLHLNIDLETLVRVCLTALQNNSDNLGL